MLGWLLLSDPSWRHMLDAWKLGADGGGLSFYLTGRAWFHLFGASELAFRMYSATCFGVAFVVLWLAARRFYSRSIVAFALFNTWFFSPPIVTHMGEGRFYGLLTLSTALAVWLLLGPLHAPGRTPVYLYPLTFLIHALLTTSHLLGVVYSGFLLAALLSLDWSAGRRRPWLYLAGAASWLLLLPERTALLATARVGQPHFWTPPPNLRRFIGVYTAFSVEIALVLLLLALALFWTWKRDPSAWTSSLRKSYRDRRPVWAVTLALLLLPAAFLVESVLGPSLFINRYLMPVTIAQVLVTAEAVRLVSWPLLLPTRWSSHRPALHRYARPAAALLFTAALLFWDFRHLFPIAIPQPNYTDSLTALLPKHIPVVFEDAAGFTEVIGRQHASGVRYTYLLDWPHAISPDAPLFEVTQFHLMENWKRSGYFAGSIADSREFLQHNPQFFVIQVEPYLPTPEPLPVGNPLVATLSHTPPYTVRPYASLTYQHVRDSIWLVCKVTCAGADSQTASVVHQAQTQAHVSPGAQRLNYDSSATVR